jgi:hypothetical protein
VRPRAHAGKQPSAASSPGERPEPSQGELEASVAAGLPMGHEDVTPLPLPVTQAGGLNTDLDGSDVLTGNGAAPATSGHIHDEMMLFIAVKRSACRPVTRDLGPAQ